MRMKNPKDRDGNDDRAHAARAAQARQNQRGSERDEHAGFDNPRAERALRKRGGKAMTVHVLTLAMIVFAFALLDAFCSPA